MPPTASPTGRLNITGRIRQCVYHVKSRIRQPSTAGSRSAISLPPRPQESVELSVARRIPGFRARASNQGSCRSRSVLCPIGDSRARGTARPVHFQDRPGTPDLHRIQFRQQRPEHHHRSHRAQSQTLPLRPTRRLDAAFQYFSYLQEARMQQLLQPSGTSRRALPWRFGMVSVGSPVSEQPAAESLSPYPDFVSLGCRTGD